MVSLIRRDLSFQQLRQAGTSQRTKLIITTIMIYDRPLASGDPGVRLPDYQRLNDIKVAALLLKRCCSTEVGYNLHR
jgi:hypothetical protein